MIRPRTPITPLLEVQSLPLGFLATLPGRLTLFAVFAALMKLLSYQGWVSGQAAWLWLTVAAAIVSLAGQYRRHALLICGGVFLLHDLSWIDSGTVTTILRQEYLSSEISRRSVLWLALPVYFAAAVLIIEFTRRFRAFPVVRTPVLVQHVIYCCILVLVTSKLLQGIWLIAAWGLFAIYSTYFWYLAYALIDQKHRTPAPLTFQFATFNPFAWPTLVPMGKGAANWGGVEARNASELALTQFKGVKLLVWALFLSGVFAALRWSVYQQVGIPELKLAFDRFLEGKPFLPYLNLLSVVMNFPMRLLEIAIMGHIIISTARLAGFRLLRNTYRPLSARTVVEFWNRYVYYFKELLAHVYFYPTFVRCFRQHPRLRIAFATFMAAGVGNFFFHLTLQGNTIAKYGLLEALIRMQTYAFYCLILTLGIVVSQLRTRKSRGHAGWVRRHLLPALGVASFFCFVSFFDGPQRHVSLVRHIEFLLYSFGLPYRF